jgi:hypothetical protein
VFQHAPAVPGDALNATRDAALAYAGATGARALGLAGAADGIATRAALAEVASAMAIGQAAEDIALGSGAAAQDAANGTVHELLAFELLQQGTVENAANGTLAFAQDTTNGTAGFAEATEGLVCDRLTPILNSLGLGAIGVPPGGPPVGCQSDSIGGAVLGSAMATANATVQTAHNVSQDAVQAGTAIANQACGLAELGPACPSHPDPTAAFDEANARAGALVNGTADTATRTSQAAFAAATMLAQQAGQTGGQLAQAAMDDARAAQDEANQTASDASNAVMGSGGSIANEALGFVGSVPKDLEPITGPLPGL